MYGYAGSHIELAVVSSKFAATFSIVESKWESRDTIRENGTKRTNGGDTHHFQAASIEDCGLRTDCHALLTKRACLGEVDGGRRLRASSERG